MMLNKKPKIYLLGLDHTVSKSKKTIAQLKASRILSRVKWVLIPIQHTSATYIAVDARTISDFDFTSIDIRYHMKLRETDRLDRGNPKGRTLYDYYTITVTANTIEEFYNALYNILIYRYHQELFGYMETGDVFRYIDVVDIQITFYRNHKKVGEYIHESETAVDEIPWDCDTSDEMNDWIARTFGLYGRSISDVRNIAFVDKVDTLMWYESKSPITLTSKVRTVLCSNMFARSFVIMPVDDYDRLLRMRSGHLYINPIDLRWLANDSDDINDKLAELLPITTYMTIPKYEFSNFTINHDDNFGTPSVYLFEAFGAAIYETFAFELVDSEDVIFFIDNLSYVMKIMQEGFVRNLEDGHYTNTENESDSIPSYRYRVTTHVEFIIDLAGPNADVPDDHDSCLIINSDAFQNFIPTIAEVAYLLQLEGDCK